MILCCLLCSVASWSVSGQNGRKQVKPQDLPPEMRPPHPPEKTEQRFLIDAKRSGEDLNGEDALPRSREFKRIDSTYYLGWMYEGAYKYNHAEDYLGYKNAAVPLARALDLMERDYAAPLGTRTDNMLTYYPTHRFKLDYTIIAYYLMNCYSNTDQPDKVFALLQRAAKWKMQHHYYLEVYNAMAWTVHRNRFYTHDKYAFLKNSIAENEQLAQRYLDSSMMQISRNHILNKTILPELEEPERMGVYHYKNILYGYALKIDSANHYFNLMREGNRLPHNNYGNFKMVCGDFRTAESEYKIAGMYDGGDKRLQEWAYYSSLLDIYKGETKEGIELEQNMIRSSGSTPGFGWYNIGLARCLMYDGQISEAKRHIEKAAEFKEVHIGTTLGQSHYDFSIQLLKLIEKEHEWEMHRFENRKWYLHPDVMAGMMKDLGEIYMQQFLIINQFAKNPERDNVIYKLFSTESTVSWDEIRYLVKDFSPGFFIHKFQTQALEDRRKYVRKYFNLMVAGFYVNQKRYMDAKAILNELPNDEHLDFDYEKLFTARVYEFEARCAEGLGKTHDRDTWLYRLYTLYPQLVPFTGMAVNMDIHLSGAVDPIVQARLNELNVSSMVAHDGPTVQAYVTFTKTGDRKDISYYVIDNEGKYVVKKQQFAWQKPEAAARDLAYRLFGIGGKMPNAEPE